MQQNFDLGYLELWVKTYLFFPKTSAISKHSIATPSFSKIKHKNCIFSIFLLKKLYWTF